MLLTHTRPSRNRRPLPLVPACTRSSPGHVRLPSSGNEQGVLWTLTITVGSGVDLVRDLMPHPIQTKSEPGPEGGHASVVPLSRAPGCGVRFIEEQKGDGRPG